MMLEEVMEMLDSLIGLDSVKQKLKAWVETVKTSKEQKNKDISYNLVFIGNPGIGKTAVARLMGQIYRALGILSDGIVIEVNRNDLIGMYVGQTAIKTQDMWERAKGQVLVVDEADTLYGENQWDFGNEALDTLLALMDNDGDDHVVILSGYPENMFKFLKACPGVCARFGFDLEEYDDFNKLSKSNLDSLVNLILFDDYTAEEMYEIFKKLCEKYQYDYAENVELAVKEYFGKVCAENSKEFQNARGVRNFFQEIIARQAQRVNLIDNPTKEDLCTFFLEDLPF